MVKAQRTLATTIKRIALFRTLPPETTARLAEGASAITLPRGGCLFRRGERSPGLYFVTGGRIMLSVGTADASKVVELIGPGEFIGLAAALLGSPEMQTAEMLADSTLLLIPREVLLACVADNAGLGLRLAAALSRQVVASTADIEAFALHSGRQRALRVRGEDENVCS